MAYTLLIESVDQTALLDANSVFINKKADYRGSFSFSLTTTADDVWTTDGLSMGQTCEFKEGTTTVFGGVVNGITIARLEPLIGSDTPIRVYISVIDYNVIASRRVSSNVFQSMYAGAIVTSYVNDILGLTGFDDGVGIGTISNGAFMNVFSSQAESVKESLDKLAEASGFKWYIDDDKNMNFVSEDTIVNAAYELVETAPTFTDFNIVNIEISSENYRNKQWVIGQFDDTGEQIAVSVEDTAEIAYRASIENNSGVYGNTIRDTNSQTVADATIVAQNALKRYGTIPYILTFTTYTNEFIAGTKLKANLPTVAIASDMYFLVESVVIEDMGGSLMSTVTCTRRSNTDFSTQRTEDYKDYFAKLIKNSTGSSAIVNEAGHGYYGSYYDITTALAVTTAPVTRSLDVYLPYTSDAMTSLTIAFTAVATGTLTLTYKVDTVTKYTFTVDYVIGSNTRTFSLPESAHATGTMTIDVDLVVSAGTLTLNDYILTSRWERSIAIPAPILLSATAELI